MPLKWMKWRPTASARSTNQSCSSFGFAEGLARTGVVGLRSLFASEAGAGPSAAHPASRAAHSHAAASRVAWLDLAETGWAALSEFQQFKAGKYVTIQPHGHWPMSADG